MKEKRELPTIEIMGTQFLVNVEEGRFIQQDDERNSFSFYEMDYKGTHYEMAYNETFKNPLFANPRKCIVKIPQLIEIDPEGMARKYNVSVKDLEGKTDFDLKVDQEEYYNRVYLGSLPVIDIDGDRFFVDMRFDELRFTKDYSKRINLQDHRSDLGKYCFYYDQSAKQAANIKPDITKLPAGVVKVELPDAYVLDPLVQARLITPFRKSIGINEVKDFLMKAPFHKNLKANVIPLSETELVEKIRANKEAKQTENKTPLLKKNRKRSGEGQHL